LIVKERLVIFGENKIMGLNCVLLGAGNVASHLGPALKAAGYKILQVYSRTDSSARQLALKLEAVPLVRAGDVISDADFYFVALSDSAFAEVLPQIKIKNGLLVHCSGSQPLSVLSPFATRTGVLYPLQTFSKSREVDFFQVPLLIEADSEKNLKALEIVAGKLSETVHVADSGQRQALHVAAVFACNFVNHLYVLAEGILNEKQLPFSLIKPLIQETAGKALEIGPINAQTGPAVRYDLNILEKHLEYLSRNPELQELYKTFSKGIFELSKNKR